MSRYVDADALKEWIDEYVSVFKKSDTREIKGYIEHQPTIDAVSVVRCKECKYEPICSHSVQHTTHEPTSVTIGYKSVDFCSYGQKGDENVETD